MPSFWKSTEVMRDTFKRVPVVSTDLTGRVVLVTGSNTGLGYQAALSLARMSPSRLILAVRSLDKGREAARKIELATHYGGCEVWELDMLDMKSVKAFADKVDRDCARLDIAILNAGMFMRKWELAPSGFTKQLQVNTVSTLLLARLLVKSLVATAALPPLDPSADFKPHLSIVSSSGHNSVSSFPEEATWGDGDIFKTLSAEKYGSMTSYTVTKAALMVTLGALVDSLKPAERDAITINTADPGAVLTDIGRDFGPLVVALMKVFCYLTFRSPEVGSRLLVAAALKPTSQNAYIAGTGTERAPSKLVQSEHGRDIGRRMLAELTGLWKAADLLS